MDANISHNPSYAWRSIWSSRILLKEGTRWGIGDGNNIPLFGIPWMQNGQTLSSQHFINNVFPIFCVQDLWYSSMKAWKVPLVEAIFPSNIANSILKTPFNGLVNEDQVIWKHNSDYIFLVSSAYHLAIPSLVDTSHLQESGVSLVIWKLKVPPRVKIFMWHACRGYLPS